MTKLDKIISWVLIAIALAIIAILITLIIIQDYNLMMIYTLAFCGFNSMFVCILASGIFRGRNTKEKN